MGDDLRYTPPKWLANALKEGAMADVAAKNLKEKQAKAKSPFGNLYWKLAKAFGGKAKPQFRTMETRQRGGESQIKKLEKSGDL